MNGRKTSRGVRLQLLTLLFLLLSALLLRLSAAAWQLSAKSADKNHAIQLCRSAAEAFSEKGELADASRALGGGGETLLFFDAEGHRTEQTESRWSMSLTARDEAAAAGVLRCAAFTAQRDGEELYKLETELYLPGR